MTDHDPLILAMVAKLPRVDEVFTSGDRERWLTAMAAVLELLYPPEWSQEARQKAREARSERVDAIRTTVTVDPDVMLRITESWIPKLPPEEEPSTTSADAVDDASGGEAASDSGAGPAPDTSAHPTESSPAPATGQDTSPTSPSTSAPTSPSTADPVPDKPETLAERLERRGIQSDVPVPGRIAPPRPNRKRHFSHEAKAELVRRCVREGVEVVEDDTLIGSGTLRKWMREFHDVVSAIEEAMEVERRRQALEEGHPSVAELEAEKDKPVPPRVSVMEDVERRAAESRAPVQWPTGPIERRPFNPEQARSHQAGQS